MKPHVWIQTTAGVLAAMTPAQLDALQKHILADGRWETQTEMVRISGHGDYIGVYVAGMFIGIEQDGYTHS